MRPWNGAWELATVDGDERRRAVDRAALRDSLRSLRLAELREGVWGRPDNLDATRSPEAAAFVAEWCHRWRGAVPVDPPSVAALWDLPDWSTTATALRRDMRRLSGPLGRGRTEALADGFVTSAAVLRHLQADPLLPPELLPRRWPGDTLRADYDSFDVRYRTVLRNWFRADG